MRYSIMLPLSDAANKKIYAAERRVLDVFGDEGGNK